MALVQASETASFTSSMRSSARTRRVDATEETTSRTSATNSGRAGISSSSTSSIGRLGGDSGVHGVVDGEHLGEPGDLEDLEDAVLSTDERDALLAEAGGGVHVHLALHRQHRVGLMAVVDVETEIHNVPLLHISSLAASMRLARVGSTDRRSRIGSACLGTNVVAMVAAIHGRPICGDLVPRTLVPYLQPGETP